jgi:hypothetical protein
MRYGYQVPRTVAVLGKDRTDLAVQLSSVSLDGVVDISVDPETLVPQPKALRQWLLDNAYDRKLITAEQWLERAPIGDIKDLQSPDKMQWAKGKRVVEQIRLRQDPEPVIWQDNEAIQQNVLERYLILAGGTEMDVFQAAMMRWQQLADQAAMKQGPVQPQLSVSNGGASGGPTGRASKQDPRAAPVFSGPTPSVATAPVSMNAGA